MTDVIFPLDATLCIVALKTHPSPQSDLRSYARYCNAYRRRGEEKERGVFGKSASQQLPLQTYRLHNLKKSLSFSETLIILSVDKSTSTRNTTDFFFLFN